MSRETRFAYITIAAAIILTGVYHVLVFDVPYGWPFALLISLLLLLLVGVRLSSRVPQNTWAYAFLGPTVIGLVAQLLYSNDVVRSFGLLLVLVSFAFFAYWLFAPKVPLKTISNFWPGRFFMETLVPLEGAGPGSKLSLSVHGRQVLIGAAIAIPFLAIFLVLFLSADALIGKVLREVINIDNPAKLYAQIMLDGILGYFLLRYIWSSITRMEHGRHAQWSTRDLGNYSVLWSSFLSALNLLFLGFIVFQFVYFFGGKEIVESYGLTYASYAREGFFQLFTVSAFVFAIIYGIGYLTHFKSIAVRLLSAALILQSWVVIASAMKRLTLYIDAYGMSVLRFWAFTGLIFAAIGLLVLVFWIIAKASFESLTKVLALGFLYAFSAVFLINYESVIVRWNANRSATELVEPDYFFPLQLSTDALPAYRDWLATRSEDEAIGCNRLSSELVMLVRKSASGQESAQKLIQSFQNQTENRFKLVVRPEYGFDGELSEYALDWVGPIATECRVSDLKSAIRVFTLEDLKEEMGDVRRWTMSGARALEAISAF